MSQEERRKKLELQARYSQRITIAKAGRAAYIAKNFTVAVENYNKYLHILCENKELEDMYSLSPTHFDKDKDVTELLLISHVFWELSRMYDTNESFQEHFHNSLNQFVKFTANQPYQVLNAEMLRKFIKRHKNKNHVSLKPIEEAYSQIFVESKSCFIATYCFGENHPTTEQLRLFKNDLLQWPFGQRFVELYYQISPLLINKYKNSKLFIFITNFIFKNILNSFAFFTQTSIFKICSFSLKYLQKLGLNRFLDR
ncbi:MAG: hypothetical protein N4A33_08975 [Bacteriovoracaceae bacterium]|jgi:hypothetical protein|nr:hypothetical protein [Bacteriovoracaceae bacterium]